MFTLFRAPFIGKVSPVHFFWGSFDLAVTRFSGRTAPPLESDSPNLGRWVMQEAYSHEVSSVGFWPGNGGFGRPAFFSYAYPEPAGFAEAPMTPLTYYNSDLGQFILPYDTARLASSPDDAILDTCAIPMKPRPSSVCGIARPWNGPRHQAPVARVVGA